MKVNTGNSLIFGHKNTNSRSSTHTVVRVKIVDFQISPNPYYVIRGLSKF